MLIIFRYERELDFGRWNSLRKGAIFGIFIGWLSFITYIIYSVGFIFGFIVMSYDNSLNISDILIVRNKKVLKC
jgi:hypothetical protein